MGDIGQLPTTYRLPVIRPATGSGQGSEAPKRKPSADGREQERRRRQPNKDDDATHIDEYA
jgi:hypothetical protein